MECTLKNITIHYETFGEGYPIVMLHGWAADHHHMVSDLEPLFQHRDGWRRIYPDLPGTGKTPSRDWITTQDQMLEITVNFIDKVIPGQRFVLAGMSYGGYLARGVLYHRSAWMDGLLLTVPVIRGDDTQQTLPLHVPLVEDPGLIAGLEPDVAKAVQTYAIVQSRKFADALRTDFIPAFAMADDEFLSKLGDHFAFSFDVDGLPEPFMRPVLILTGRQDAVSGYRDAWDILENYPRGTFVVLDRAGHGIGIEQEGLFRALVSEWLDRVEESIGLAP